MLLRLDDRDTAPLHEKIAAGVRRALAAGELDVGERLPAARELASSLGVNMHTVLRAYAQLADEGLVAVRRGRGVTVLAAGPDRANCTTGSARWSTRRGGSGSNTRSWSP